MITTASELWGHWTSKNLLRPQDYDRDIGNLVRSNLGDSSISTKRLASAMDVAGWSARDLIRVILPELASFSGMIVDLLALYERVGATRADKENLRIVYEFASGVPLDDSLAPFREVVRRTQATMSEVEAFTFRLDHVFQSPLGGYAQDPFASGLEALEIDQSEDLRTFPFTLEIPRLSVSDPALRTLATQHRQVIVAALAQLSELGPTYGAIRHALDAETSPSLSEDAQSLIQATSDHWWIFQIGVLHELPTIIEGLSPHAAAALIHEHAIWLDGFWRTEVVTIEQQIDDLTDILSLPYWGQRFDLYSAWLAAVMDTALAPRRLTFDVSDGVLAFPFRATLLARVATSRGPVELWCEKRFTASNLIGKGRKENIQPDFVFIDSATSTVSVVIEAKQYKTAYSKNPGCAAHDYAGNLDDANVLIVAHGPLRPDSIDLVAPADRVRVAFHSDVRPGSPLAVERFRASITELLPPPDVSIPRDEGKELGDIAHAPSIKRDTSEAVARPSATSPSAGTVALRWSPDIYDLDLHLVDEVTEEAVYYQNLSASHARLGSDAFNGGPECAILHSFDGGIIVEVRLFSAEVDTVQDAVPAVSITTLRESVTLTPLPELPASRVWRVATVRRDGSVILHPHTTRQ